MRPNTRPVNLFISITLGSQFLTQWNLNTSLSDFRVLICKKAFSIFPHNRMGQKRVLIRISHSEFCSGGPVSSHSFKDNDSLFGLVSFSGVLFLFAFSMIPSFICSCYTPQTYLTKLSFLLSYVICQDYSLHYCVMEDDFLSR